MTSEATSTAMADSAEFALIEAYQIVNDEDFNSRQYGSFGTGLETAGTAAGHCGLTDEQLRDDIKKRGQLQPIGVRVVGDEYHCYYGHRRLRACRAVSPNFPVKCLVASGAADKFDALAANVRENMHRRSIKPFELADTLFRMSCEREGMTIAEVAEAVGISRPYAAKLIAIRKRACPELWQLFSAYGLRFSTTIQYTDMIPIVKLPKTEQVEKWHELVARVEEVKRVRKSNPRRRASIKTITKWLADLESMPQSKEYVAGMRDALRCVNGTMKWPGSTPHLVRQKQSQRRAPADPEPGDEK